MRQVQELTPIISRLKGAIAENTTVKWMEKGCTPFIGAGLSGDVFNDVRTASLVEYLTKKGGVPPWVPKKLQVITEYLKVEPGWKIRDEVAEYIDNVTNYRNDPNPEGLDTLRQVAELPFRVYITTNYDDLIEQALKKVNKKPRRVLSGWFFDQEVVRKTKITRPDILKRLNNKEHEIFAGEDPPRFFDPLDVSALTNEMEPVVFHLHGHFIEPLSMVLTEEDYIDFLVAFSKFKKKRKSDILPPYIDMLLKQQTLLFAIGYSLRDQNFQVLLRTIKDTLEMPTEKTHDISVQIEPDASDCIQKILQNRNAARCFD